MGHGRKAIEVVRIKITAPPDRTANLRSGICHRHRISICRDHHCICYLAADCVFVARFRGEKRMPAVIQSTA
jgi:hypothetical protein